MRHKEEIVAREICSRENQERVIKYLEGSEDKERKAIYDFIKDHGLGTFPYPFSLTYDAENIEVFGSEERDEKYVLYDGKKLYFKKKWDEEEVKRYFNSLRIEQDVNSPHYYFGKGEYLPSKDDVIADIGAAEGIWALAMIERCGLVYLFESDGEWIKALKATFAPWSDKVVIVNKFVGAEDDGENIITLDSFFADKRIDCVKADIEGAEEDMLRGGETVFRDKVSKAVICSYHKPGDEQMIKSYLDAYGFERTETSDGYMIFGAFEEEILKPPYLSRGLVFAGRD
jgi:hypothetical protein